MGLEDKETPSLFSEKHRGLEGSGLPVLLCFPLACCGQILQISLGLHRDPAWPGVGTGKGMQVAGGYSKILYP